MQISRNNFNLTFSAFYVIGYELIETVSIFYISIIDYMSSIYRKFAART
jgi:hypothetical protein